MHIRVNDTVEVLDGDDRGVRAVGSPAGLGRCPRALTPKARTTR